VNHRPEYLGQREPAQATWRDRLRSASLSSRVMVGSAALAIVIAAVFGILIYAVYSLDAATKRERHAKAVTAASLQIENLVLDLETGLRGFIVTRDPSALDPWRSARDALPKKLAAFKRLSTTTREQRSRAAELTTLINRYLYDYSIPVVRIVREVPSASRTDEVKYEGAIRTSAIRNKFAEFRRAENALAAASTSSAQRRFDEALAVAIAGLILSAILIGGFGLYLARSIARPVRDVADGATRLASGDLSTRLVPHGPGEIQELTTAFNQMAERLEQGRRELEEQNERLRESEAVKSELVSVVAHELRTPLASVLGFTQVLLQRELPEEDRREYLNIIDAQGRRLASLVNDFLDVEQLEEGRLVLARDLVDMGRIVREQTQLFARQSPRHRLDVSLPEAPLAVRGDSNRLAQVVANLLSNAIKYSPEGGTVRVAGEREGSSVKVTVRDQGLGIPDEVQKEIFGKFVRGHATADGIEGSGLGLAISRSLVEAHSGHIDFESALGQGSTFWFELPTAVSE
jgi:signal transduction histidine kinase